MNIFKYIRRATQTRVTKIRSHHVVTESDLVATIFIAVECSGLEAIMKMSDAKLMEEAREELQWHGQRSWMGDHVDLVTDDSELEDRQQEIFDYIKERVSNFS